MAVVCASRDAQVDTPVVEAVPVDVVDLQTVAFPQAHYLAVEADVLVGTVVTSSAEVRTPCRVAGSTARRYDCVPRIATKRLVVLIINDSHEAAGQSQYFHHLAFRGVPKTRVSVVRVNSPAMAGCAPLSALVSMVVRSCGFQLRR